MNESNISINNQLILQLKDIVDGLYALNRDIKKENITKYQQIDNLMQGFTDSQNEFRQIRKNLESIKSMLIWMNILPILVILFFLLIGTTMY